MDQLDIAASPETACPVAPDVGPRGPFDRFARSEDGSILIFGLILFMLMLMLGGLAVDLMSFEAKRTDLQQSIDRCALAGAALSQTRKPDEVVTDCMQKAGKAQYLTHVAVNEGLNYREVVATATQPTNPLFVHMLGLDKLDAPAATKAEQKITNVEVVLVLDVSGSMKDKPSRITNLKSAATEFVDLLLKNDLNHRISIALVPYNGQVNLGSTMIARYNVPDPVVDSGVNCIDINPSTYGDTAITSTQVLRRTAHADARAGTDTSNGFVAHTDSSDGKPNSANFWCPSSTVNVVRPPNGVASTIKTQINNLNPIGATSIDAGMKWGVAMIDPASRDIVSKLVTAGTVPSYFAGRPFDYGDKEAMKVIVLMTDGANWPEHRVNDAYKAGNSGIYFSKGDSNMSIYHASKAKYWVPHRNSGAGEWRTAPWNSGSGYVQLTWPEVWQKARVSWVAWQLYARALGTDSSSRSSHYSTWMKNFRTVTGVEKSPSTLNEAPEMDSRLQDICTAAKANGVRVFGIAFEAEENGKTQIQKCATSIDSHYFDTTGTQLQAAFRAIASQISYLRLSQ